VGWCSGISFMNQTTGNGVSCGATQFPSQGTGTQLPLTQANISNDAMYRTVNVANSMLNQGIVIYAIGMGDKISAPFLQQVANDPASSTYNPKTATGRGGVCSYHCRSGRRLPDHRLEDSSPHNAIERKGSLANLGLKKRP
jgi:hypothetical protein